MPRLFTGIEIPDDAREALKRLRTPLPGARWIEPDNFHITLRFMGDIGNLAARELADNLAAVELPPFELGLAGLGSFGGQSPKSIWAGVEHGPELENLARANERAARAAGLEPEKHAFKAHVTLARLQHARSEPVAAFLQRNGGFRLDPFYVDRFVLFSSKPQTGGGPYVVEEDYPLLGLRQVAARP